MDLANFLKNRWLVGLVITLFAVIFALILSTIPVFEMMELQSINSRFNIRGTIAPDTSIVIVAVDDATYSALPGKWPYPRAWFAKVIENLSKAGARLIVFDIEFTEASELDPGQDIILAKAVNDIKKIILAGKVVTEVGRHGTESSHAVKPILPLQRTGVPWGVVNTPEDLDGFVRKYLIYQKSGGQIYYSIGMQALLELLGVTQDAVQINQKQKILRAEKYNLKLFDLNTMLINFRGPAKTFSTYSFSDILDDSSFDLSGDEDTDIFDMHLEWGTFKNKIVLIGATVAELQDNKFTPFFDYQGKKRKIPGVEVHANAISTMLRGDFLHEMNRWLQLFFLLGFTALAMVITLSFKPFVGLLFNVVEIGIIGVFSSVLFSKQNIIMNVTTPMIAVILAYVANIVYQTFTEQKEKRRYRETFKHYVSAGVVEKMLGSGVLPKFGGERKELTTLFSDIRQFTRYSERRAPQEVVHRLSEYLTEMVEVIFKNNGTLDKFVGDEIMAVFGAPYYFEAHAEKACRTAIEMVKQLRKIQIRWSADKKDFFHIGIGINTGNVIVGNLGSKQLFDYTVIGDAVNIAARLEGANKQYETTVIISENTYKQVKEKAKVRELDLVRVVGRKEPIRIYELRAMDNIPQIERDFIIDVFTDGLIAYRECRWYDALREFRRVLRYFPSDGPSKVYTKRCLDFIENPPPPGWDGVYDFKTK